MVLGGGADVRRPRGGRDAPTLAERASTTVHRRSATSAVARDRRRLGERRQRAHAGAVTDPRGGRRPRRRGRAGRRGGAAYWLARHGHDVTVVEKRRVPAREDVRRRAHAARPSSSSIDMGLDGRARASSTASPRPARHRAWGASSSWSGRRTPSTRSTATSCAGVTARPVRRRATPTRPVPRCSRATRPSARSSTAGSCAAPTVIDATTATPIELRAEYTIVADGANSRFGRALGTFRTRDVALRHGDPDVLDARRCTTDPWIESAARRQGPQREPDAGLRLDLPGRRRHREHRRRLAVDLPRLQERQHRRTCSTRTRTRSPSAGRSTRRIPTARPVSGRIPMGGSVGPKAGPTYLVVGDAAGAASTRSTGKASTTRYETGADGRRRDPRGARRRRRCGAAALSEAADDEYGQYFKVGPAVRQGASAARR